MLLAFTLTMKESVNARSAFTSTQPDNDANSAQMDVFPALTNLNVWYVPKAKSYLTGFAKMNFLASRVTSPTESLTHA